MTAAAPAVRRRSLPRATRLDFWVDAAIALAWVLDDSFRFTGLTVHEWIGVALAPALLVHLALHWDWVVRTTRRLAGTFPARERVRWAVDLCLLIAMVLCVASGILVSRSAMPAIGWKPLAGPFWNGLHGTAAALTVVLLAVHLGLNWRWITSVSRRLFGRNPMRGGATGGDAL